MPQNRQGVPNPPHLIDALSETISQPRLHTYLAAAGHDRDRALALYLWNAKMGEAFHVPIQAVEVGLRNRVNTGLVQTFGTNWWREQKFLNTITPHCKRDIEKVEQRLVRQGQNLSVGQIVGGLTFGFWVTILDKRHNPSIWGAALRTAFPHLPAQIGRDELHARARGIADLRNRISHHEPIMRRNLSADYAECLEMLRWLCPVKTKWIKPHCRVPQVLREKP